jgi:lipid-A-disaccharide synthase
MAKDPRIFIVAGEASGDMHAANLIREIYRLCPDAEIRGLGGPKMAAAGCDVQYDMMEKSVMWFKKVLGMLPWVYKIQKQMLREFDEAPPDALILIDYPGFNLTLARWMRKRPTPVLYYIAPQVWAWFTHRIRKIRKRTQKVFVILPFEEALYESAGIPVEYVGHPLFDYLRDVERGLDEDFISRLEENPHRTIGLLPGSRDEEVERLLPVMVRGAKELRKRIPDTKFYVPIGREVHKAVVERILAKLNFRAELLLGKVHEIMKSADLCIVTSGTATLELLHFNTPMIILYRLSLFSYLVAKSAIRTEHIGLVNIIAGDDVVPEKLLYHDNSRWIADKAVELLTDAAVRKALFSNMAKVRTLIDSPGASRKAAQDILKYIADYKSGRVQK